jgi:hypothetical protein
MKAGSVPLGIAATFAPVASSTAGAQSSVRGTVRDETGAGVSVVDRVGLQLAF